MAGDRTAIVAGGEGRNTPAAAHVASLALAGRGAPSVIVADHFRRPELADALDASPMPRGRFEEVIES